MPRQIELKQRGTEWDPLSTNEIFQITVIFIKAVSRYLDRKYLKDKELDKDFPVKLIKKIKRALIKVSRVISCPLTGDPNLEIMLKFKKIAMQANQVAQNEITENIKMSKMSPFCLIHFMNWIIHGATFKLVHQPINIQDTGNAWAKIVPYDKVIRNDTLQLQAYFENNIEECRIKPPVPEGTIHAWSCIIEIIHQSDDTDSLMTEV